MTRMRRTAACAAVATMALAAPGGAAGAAELARPERATPVDADLGLVVWSAYDAQAGGFRLALRNGAGRTRTLPTPVSPVPFDADIGDDERRRRVVVYALCPAGPDSCDVRMVRVGQGGDGPVAAAARPGVREHAPTISRGRIAWAAGGGPQERPRVLLQDLASAREPVTLPGLPRRRCGEQLDGTRGCVPVTGSISELELRGNTLAQVASSTTAALRTSELRLVDVERRTSALGLSFGVGESGQALVGASIEGSHVYAYKTCFGDPSGCEQRAGTYRWSLDTGRLELARTRRQLAGFSVDRDRVVAADGSERRWCELEQGDYPGVPGVRIGPCPIEERALPARWARVRR